MQNIDQVVTLSPAALLPSWACVWKFPPKICLLGSSSAGEKKKKEKQQQSAASPLLRKSRAGEFLAGTFKRALMMVIKRQDLKWRAEANQLFFHEEETEKNRVSGSTSSTRRWRTRSPPSPATSRPWRATQAASAFQEEWPRPPHPHQDRGSTPGEGTAGSLTEFYRLLKKIIDLPRGKINYP